MIRYRCPRIYTRLELLVELRNDESLSPKARAYLTDLWSFHYEVWACHWRIVFAPAYRQFATL